MVRTYQELSPTFASRAISTAGDQRVSSTKAPMTDKGKNVTGVALVTGAAGFVGRNTVVSLLQCGYHVRAIDLPSVDLSSALGGLSKNSNLSSISRDILSIDVQSFYPGKIITGEEACRFV